MITQDALLFCLKLHRGLPIASMVLWCFMILRLLLHGIIQTIQDIIMEEELMQMIDVQRDLNNSLL